MSTRASTCCTRDDDGDGDCALCYRVGGCEAYNLLQEIKLGDTLHCRICKIDFELKAILGKSKLVSLYDQVGKRHLASTCHKVKLDQKSIRLGVVS